jgi:hypothetical protein
MNWTHTWATVPHPDASTVPVSARKTIALVFKLLCSLLFLCLTPFPSGSLWVSDCFSQEYGTTIVRWYMNFQLTLQHSIYNLHNMYFLNVLRWVENSGNPVSFYLILDVPTWCESPESLAMMLNIHVWVLTLTQEWYLLLLQIVLASVVVHAFYFLSLNARMQCSMPVDHVSLVFRIWVSQRTVAL